MTLHPTAPRAVPLSGRSGETRPFRLLGQYKGTVILMEGPDGLYLIDQHVAHERVLYERIRRNLLADAPQSQALLEPHLIELSRSEALRAEELCDALEASGLSAGLVDERTLGVSRLPAGMEPGQAESLLHTLLASSEGGQGPEDVRRRLIEDAAASMSCRAAVKMHDALGVDEMERLIEELFEAEQPYTCPHGRPVFLRLTDEELERAYKRR